MSFELDSLRFFDACDPSRTLVITNPEDRKYYINFASVRGGKIIEALEGTIAKRSRLDQPTCQLFTGHIGCGKSTELRRLQADLTQKGFHVVYSESQDLDMADVDVTDILLAIARQVSKSLEDSNVNLSPKGFRELLRGAIDFLQREVEFSMDASVPGLGDASLNSEGEFSLSLGIGKITARTKESPKLRDRLRQYMEPRTSSILNAINEELLKPAITMLRAQGKQDLVIIIDNLDRVHNRPNSVGRTQPEYLFVDRGDQLRGLKCHVVYTIPLSLIFSNESGMLINRMGGGVPPKMLPMVPVQQRDGSIFEPGIALLRQMILARAFPELNDEQRLTMISPHIFDEPATLDRLCYISGGHVRNLLGILYGCLQEDDPPVSRDALERAIRSHRDALVAAITDEEWKLIHQVVTQQNVSGEQGHQTLLRSLFVFEYQDMKGRWFNVNPLLAETEKFKSL